MTSETIVVVVPTIVVGPVVDIPIPVCGKGVWSWNGWDDDRAVLWRVPQVISFTR